MFFVVKQPHTRKIRLHDSQHEALPIFFSWILFDPCNNVSKIKL